MRKYILFISLFFISETLLSQISLIGRVISEDGPLPGAHLWKKNDYEISTISNTDGFFQLSGLQKADTLVCTFMGYQEFNYRVNTNQDSLIIFMHNSAQQMEVVEVRGSVLGAENFAFKKIEPLEIYENPNSKADALVAINTQMSSTTKDENAAVAFRGASPQQTGYFLNGVPVKEPVKYAQLTNTGTLSIFNTDFLKSATVFPGNPPLEYGQATSGTIILELADRFPQYWQNTLSVSMANLGYSGRGQIGKNSFLGVFGNFQFDNLLKTINANNFQEINNFSALEGGFLLTSHHTWGSLKFYQYGLSDQYGFKYDHPSYEGLLAQKANRSISTLQWVQDYGFWTGSVIFGNSFLNKRFDFGNLDYSEENNDPYISSNWSYVKDGVRLKAGYAFWKQSSSILGKVPQLIFALGPLHPSRNIKLKESLTSHEIYTYASKKWGKHNIGAGVRTGLVSEKPGVLWSYQFNYLFKFSDDWSFKVAQGRYYQTRIETSPKIITQDQTSLDLAYRNESISFNQSFFYNYGDFETKGSESRVSMFFGRDIEFNQTVSFYENDFKWDWFSRSFLNFSAYNNWTFNISFVCFKGNTYRLVNSVNYHEKLDVFEPLNKTSTYFFKPYQNLSLGVNRIFSFSKKINGIAFLNLNNIFDTKNPNTINYNKSYSEHHNSYLSRRSIYAGFILNIINK